MEHLVHFSLHIFFTGDIIEQNSPRSDRKSQDRILCSDPILWHYLSNHIQGTFMKAVHRTDYPRGQNGTFCFQQNKFGKKKQLTSQTTYS